PPKYDTQCMIHDARCKIKRSQLSLSLDCRLPTLSIPDLCILYVKMIDIYTVVYYRKRQNQR
ncbi:MAG: hypothetical protein V3R78_06970, partial [Thermodesulfobacteriota bacterium]